MSDQVSSIPESQPVLSKWATGACFIGGVVLPALSMLVAASGLLEMPEWQSDQFHDFTKFLVGGRAGLFFFPFLAYSMVCVTLALFQPQLVARSFAARLGLYTGVALALHYCVLFGALLLQVSNLKSPAGIVTLAVWTPLYSVTIVLLAWGAWWLVGAIVRSCAKRRRWLPFVVFGLPVLAIAVAAAQTSDPTTAFLAITVLLPVFLAITFAPCWFLVATVAMTVRMVRLRATRFQYSTWNLLAIITWIAAYLSAWRIAVYDALAAYSALPTTPPNNCYIATAAANGHRTIVRWREIPCGGGSAFRVNRQLEILKCGEIVLRTTAPRLHRGLRRLYDWIGPPLAGCLRNRWAADAAYLTLKPAEWATQLAFTVVAPKAIHLARRLYEKAPPR